MPLTVRRLQAGLKPFGRKGLLSVMRHVKYSRFHYHSFVEKCYFCTVMAQKLIQTQEQKQVQAQRLTQQQMLMVKLLEMPLTELEQSVEAELDDNPALESAPADAQGDDPAMADDAPETDADEDFDAAKEREDRKDALDDALAGLGMDDEMPEAAQPEGAASQAADYEEITYGDTVSFYDRLKEQMVGIDLTPKQRGIMEYLIGSLDGDGLLRKDAGALSDELAVYHNVDADENEIGEVLKILQTFDPAGVGARDLRECLLLQVRRKPKSELRRMMEDVVTKCFDEFMSKRWDKIAAQLGYDATTAQKVHAELLKLNPKPGAALGETEGRSLQQVTPDFIVDTADDGTVSFTVNGGRVPELYVSPSFADMVKAYRGNKGSMSRRDKEALLYAKEKVARAQGFIDAVKQRRHTLYVTMKAIIDIQKKYFQDGDEGDLKPMILKDVAERTGLDISTVSRVSNMKYAQTRWGTFRLRHFFSDSVKTDGGGEMSTRRVKAALKDIIDGEDKAAPLSDDAITGMMAAAGYPVARRTIAKYREQMGIPVARLRKK